VPDIVVRKQKNVTTDHPRVLCGSQDALGSTSQLLWVYQELTKQNSGVGLVSGEVLVLPGDNEQKTFR
jgi:hypothetical protein